MSEVFEILMVVSFGLSWPISLYKSYKSKSTKGKSVFFLGLIFIGYMFGITAKLISDNFKWYVLAFYILNSLMVFGDIILYFRNRSLEKSVK